MDTLLAVLAVAAVSIVLFMTLLGMRRTRRLVLDAAGQGFTGLATASRWTARTLEFFLSPRAGVIAPWKYLAWMAVNLLPLALVLGFNYPAVVAVLSPTVPVADLGVLLVAAALFQSLVLLAALITIHDDYDVMHGLIDAQKRRVGSARITVGTPVVLSAVVLFLIYCVAIVYWLDAIQHLDLFARSPEGGSGLVNDILVVLWSLPTSAILRPVDWYLGVDSRVVFNTSAVARAVYAGMLTVGWGLFVGFAALLFQMAWQLRRTIMELGAGREGEQHQIMARTRLAPPIIKGGVLDAAVSLRDETRQKRLLEAARDLGLLNFPQTFCRHLECYDEAIQHFGLERALELYRQRAPEFDRPPCEAIITQCARHLERGRLSAETTRRMVRLMVAVLATKRDIVRIDERVQAAMLAAIARELAKPREALDAACRGVLQDLRGAVTRLSKAKTPAADNDAWISRLTPVAATERRAVRHDTPARTMH